MLRSFGVVNSVLANASLEALLRSVTGQILKSTTVGHLLHTDSFLCNTDATVCILTRRVIAQNKCVSKWTAVLFQLTPTHIGLLFSISSKHRRRRCHRLAGCFSACLPACLSVCLSACHDISFLRCVIFAYLKE